MSGKNGKMAQMWKCGMQRRSTYLFLHLEENKMERSGIVGSGRRRSI